MLDRFPSLGRVAAVVVAPTLVACGPDVSREIHIRAEACLASYQDGQEDVESSYTITADQSQNPVLAQMDGEQSGYLQAWYADSKYGVSVGVDVQEAIDHGLTGVAYEGNNPLAADPTEAWEVVLSTENPNPVGWEDEMQGLYSSVDFGTWDWEGVKTVSVSLFTDNCSSIVEDLNGETASTVNVSQEAVNYKE